MPGPKFTDSYGVKAKQIYSVDPGPERLIIPPIGHFLYDETSPTEVDEQKVKQFDEDGSAFSAVIEVYTDTKNKKLYVLDGRETVMTVREVNRRRALENREPILFDIKPVAINEKEAVAHMAVRNFHRRLPTPSAYALHIRQQRRAGWTWEAICQHLLVKVDDPEVWCRRRLPLAYCEPEVRAAFDNGDLPLNKAVEFGGSAEDGLEAEGREEQLGLLETLLAEKSFRKQAPKPPGKSARKRVRKALLNGETANLCFKDAEAAKVAAATLGWLDGDAKALDEWPEVRAIMESAVERKKAEPSEEVKRETSAS
jgi:hypothetical protein